MWALILLLLLASRAEAVTLEGAYAYSTNTVGAVHTMNGTITNKSNAGMAFVVCGSATLLTSINIINQTLDSKNKIKDIVINKAEVAIYAKLSPPAGTGIISSNFSKPVATSMIFLQFSGVNQSNPISTNPGKETGATLPNPPGMRLLSDFKFESGGIGIGAQFRPTTTGGINVYGVCAINTGADLKSKGQQVQTSVAVEVRN